MKSKNWYASAIAFREAKSQKEFLEMRSWLVKMYTLAELKKMYEKEEN